MPEKELKSALKKNNSTSKNKTVTFADSERGTIIFAPKDLTPEAEFTYNYSLPMAKIGTKVNSPEVPAAAIAEKATEENWVHSFDAKVSYPAPEAEVVGSAGKESPVNVIEAIKTLDFDAIKKLGKDILQIGPQKAVIAPNVPNREERMRKPRGNGRG